MNDETKMPEPAVDAVAKAVSTAVAEQPAAVAEQPATVDDAIVKIHLEPCPCGQTPETLFIEMTQQRSKYGRAVASCCGEWSIEFRNGYTADPEEMRQKAVSAWNAAPRG